MSEEKKDTLRRLLKEYKTGIELTVLFIVGIIGVFLFITLLVFSLDFFVDFADYLEGLTMFE